MSHGYVLKCNRCHGSWARRSLERMPKHCARCNSPYWNKPRYRKLSTRKLADAMARR